MPQWVGVATTRGCPVPHQTEAGMTLAGPHPVRYLHLYAKNVILQVASSRNFQGLGFFLRSSAKCPAGLIQA